MTTICLTCGELVPEGTCTCGPRQVLATGASPVTLLARVQELRAAKAACGRQMDADRERMREALATNAREGMWGEAYQAALAEFRAHCEQWEELERQRRVVAEAYFAAMEEGARDGES